MKNTYLSIALGDLALALPLRNVHKVARMVSITPVGDGVPLGMLGVVNLAGRIVPVFDPRARLGQPSRKVESSDQIVFAWAGKRLVGLWVDETGEVFRETPEGDEAEESRAATVTRGAAVWKDLHGIAGIAPLGEGLVVIRDLEAFLTEEEERLLDATLESVDADAYEKTAR